MQRYILILFLFWHSSSALGQLYILDLKAPDNKTINQWEGDQPKRQDSLSWILARNQLIRSLHHEGYLLADIEEWSFTKDTVHATVIPNQKVHWAKVSFTALEFLPPHWVSDLDMSGDVVDYNAWRTNILSVLKEAQSEGYLFADYRLNVTSLKDDSLHADVIFNPGLKIVLDTIEIEGTAQLSKEYLQKTLGIKKGEPVTPDDLALLQQQFNNLRFVQQVSPPVLILINENATIRAY